MGTKLLEYGLVVWMALVLLLIVVRIANGTIRMNGLLATETGTQPASGDTSTSPERIVALGTFLLILGFYLFQALHTDVSLGKPSLPDIPPELFALFTGTNGLYLAGKISRRA